MPTYLLHRSLHKADAPSSEDALIDGETFEARDDVEAIAVAQAAADKADGALSAVELTDTAGRRVWGLRRGETLSRRPDGV